MLAYESVIHGIIKQEKLWQNEILGNIRLGKSIMKKKNKQKFLIWHP